MSNPSVTTEHPLITGIIGAGQAGTSLLRLLLHSETMKVGFVADRDPRAAGVMLAKENGVPVFQDMEEALNSQACDMVFEMTGVPAVMDKLLSLINGSKTKVLPSHSWLLIRELEAGAKHERQQVADEITAIKVRLNGGLEGSGKLVLQINQIMSSMRVLAMNATIEAARAGSQGAGFSVVAEHMAKSVDAVRKITQEIGQVNNEILQVSNQINTALERLA
ncbi:MAG: methyl-accepting chemotaxis protein [Betaproteobacteria bacterium]